jgi:hypothetical protein
LSFRDEFSSSSWILNAEVSSHPHSNGGRRQLQEAAANLLMLGSIVLFAAAGVVALFPWVGPALRYTYVAIKRAVPQGREAMLAVPLLH